MTNKQNQLHPPLPKQKRVDAQGNDRRRFIAKSGKSTMIIAEGLTENACSILESSLKSCVAKLGGTVSVEFRVIR
ncbi:MAG: hypothetical protein ABS939_09315 [Psychrobacillus sp.]